MYIDVPLLTFSKDLNNEQLALWLSDHPRLMGTDYQHDISKVKGIFNMYMYMLTHWYSYINVLNYIEAKINGYGFLSLDKGSLDQFGLSDGFQLPLMKIIKDLVCYLYECNASP